MEPIPAATAVITPCGHVFGTELTPRVSLCPVCRSSLL
jgi:predicted Zn-ribbon and HTH transcriptional regulator